MKQFLHLQVSPLAVYPCGSPGKRPSVCIQENVRTFFSLFHYLFLFFPFLSHLTPCYCRTLLCSLPILVKICFTSESPAPWKASPFPLSLRLSDSPFHLKSFMLVSWNFSLPLIRALFLKACFCCTFHFARLSLFSSDFCCSVSARAPQQKSNLEEFVGSKCTEIHSIWFAKEESSKKKEPSAI